MRTKAPLLKVCIGCVALLTLARSEAQTFNVSNDFSITNGNPNGVWRYGWSTTLLSSLNLYTNGFIEASGNQVWNDPSHLTAGTPNDANNPSNVTQNGVPAHTAEFHPGSSDEISHFIWTAPVAGSISISATFLPLSSGGTNVYVLDQGTIIFSAAVSPGNSPSYSGTLSVLAGDRIDFAVDFGNDGSFANDATGISATISEVPEPATWAAMLAMFTVLFAFGGRQARPKQS